MKAIRSPLSRSLLIIAVSMALAGCADMRTVGSSLGPNQGLDRSAFYNKSGKLRRMPPLHERGVDSLAMVYLPSDKFVVRRYSPFRYTSSEIDAERITPRSFVEQRLLAEAGAAPFVKARLVTSKEAEVADHMTSDPDTGALIFDEKGREILAELKSKDVDALLVVKEKPLSNYVFPSGSLTSPVTYYPTPAKGLGHMTGWDVHVMAGFPFFLVDTASGKRMENSRFTQASAKPIGLRIRSEFDSYDSGEQLQIEKAVQERVANNVRVMLQLLKVIPGDDGNFLAYDPEEEERNRDYPE